MKKLLFFLCCTILGIISYQSIKEFETDQVQLFNQTLSNDSYLIEVEQGNPNLSNEENYQILQNFSTENKTNIQRTSYENNNIGQEVIVYYVSLGNKDAYFENIKLYSGNYINSNPDEFLSNVQTSEKNQVGVIDLFYNQLPIEVRPLLSASRSKDISGTYTISDKESWNLLKKELPEKGFNVSFLIKTSEEVLSEYPYSQMMYRTITILCLLIGLAIAYDLINEYKTIAIKNLFGNNFFDIGSYILKRYLPIFILSCFFVGALLMVSLYFYNQYHQFFPFLLFWLKKVGMIFIVFCGSLILNWFFTLAVNINHMIKNKKPIKPIFMITTIVRILISIFLIMSLQQSISSFLNLNKTLKKDEQWSLLKDYGYLGIIKSTEDEYFSFFDSSSTEENQFNDMMEELLLNGALYIQPSSYYMDDYFALSSEDNLSEQYVEINTNYLSLNNIKDTNKNDVTKNPSLNNNDLLTLLIPNKLKDREDEIKEMMLLNYQSDFSGELTLDKINCVYVENDQSYFTFSTYYAEHTDYEINDPIAVIINQNLKPEVLAHNISTGSSFYFKVTDKSSPLPEMENLLQKYKMEKIWTPVSIAYSTIETNIHNKKVSFSFSLMNTVISFILIFVLQIFSTLSYLEINKEELSIKWLFGYSAIERHYLYYLATLAFWSLVYMVCFFLESTPILAYLILLNVVIDYVLFNTTLLYKEKKIIKNKLLKTI